MKKEIDFEGFFPTISSSIKDATAIASFSMQEDHVDDDAISITSLDTNSSTKLSKGNRWSFKVRNCSNNGVAYVHIQRPLHSVLISAVKEKLSLPEPFSISFKDKEGDLVPILNDDDLVSLIEMILGSSTNSPTIDTPITLFVTHPKGVGADLNRSIPDRFMNFLSEHAITLSVSCGIVGFVGAMVLYRKLK